jgi:hypothetical protein
MHEEPQVHNFGRRGRGLELRGGGMVLGHRADALRDRVEAAVRASSAQGCERGMIQDVKDGRRRMDGPDGRRCAGAQFENFVAVTSNGPWVLGKN